MGLPQPLPGSPVALKSKFSFDGITWYDVILMYTNVLQREQVLYFIKSGSCSQPPRITPTQDYLSRYSDYVISRTKVMKNRLTGQLTIGSSSSEDIWDTINPEDQECISLV